MPSSGFEGTPLPLRAAKSLARNAGGANDPQMWLWSAERLFYGGQQLWALAAEHWPEPKAERHPAAPAQFGTAFLLCGYAFENALKGLVVQTLMSSGGTALKAGRIDAVLTNHNLRTLAKHANVPLSPANEDLLVRLKEHVVWAVTCPQIPLHG